MDKVRYQYIDIARGLGIILVMISHAHSVSEYLINWYIPLFFILSGITYKEGRSYKENVAKKAKRLLVPYFVCSFVLLGVYMVLGKSLEEIKVALFGIFYSRNCLYDMSTHTENVQLFTITNGPMWYLTAFFVASLVYYFLIDFAMKSKRNMWLVVIGLTTVTMALAELPVLLPWSLDLACVGALFMIVGTVLGRNQFFEQQKKWWYVIGVFLIYILLSALNPGINMSVREYGVYERWSVPFFILIGISGSILCIWIAQLLERIALGAIIEYIGKNTIILLAFHILGFEVIKMVVGRFVNLSSMNGISEICYVALQVVLSTSGCLILAKIIEIVKEKRIQK